MNGLRKSDVLRGYQAFGRVFRRGARLEGKLVRAIVAATPSPTPGVLVGFSVPARAFSAVRRNRLKRLLRTAFLAERGALVQVATERGLEVRVVLFFKGADTVEVRRLGADDLRRELAPLLAAAASARGLRA